MELVLDQCEAKARLRLQGRCCLGPAPHSVMRQQVPHLLRTHVADPDRNILAYGFKTGPIPVLVPCGPLVTLYSSEETGIILR